MTITLPYYSFGGQKLGEVTFPDWQHVPGVIRIADPEQFFRLESHNEFTEGCPGEMIGYAVVSRYVEISAPFQSVIPDRCGSLDGA